MNRFRNLLLVAAVVTAVSACGSSPSANVSPSPSPAHSAAKITKLDPCAMVTATEASTAAGKTLANAVSLGSSPIPGACFYRSKSNPAAVLVYAQVYPDSATANAVTAQQFESAMSSMLSASSSNLKDVGGIADRASEFAIKVNGGQGFAVIVFKDNVVFVIAVAPSTSASVVEGLAKTAASRLQ
jgi:hypothetical protein